MWLAPLLQVLVLGAVGTSAGGSPAATAPASPVPTFHSRAAVFAIPFHVHRPAGAVQAPVEVQLYVSADRGGSWQSYSKVDPAKGQFVFRAARTGNIGFRSARWLPAGRRPPLPPRPRN